MSKTHKKTIIFIMAVLIIMIYYVRSIPQVTLTERAIVLGMGIDAVDDGYEVTVEFVKAKSSGAENSNNDGYVLVSAIGETLSDAFDIIAHKTGLTISLSQCNVIILGSSINNINILPKIDYIVETYSVPEQTTMLVSNESAKNILKTQPIVSDNSALQIINAMHYSSDSEEIITTSIKDFYEGLNSLSQECPVALISATQVDKTNVDGQQNETTNYYEYDYTKCAIFSKNEEMIICENDVVSAINILLNNLKKGSEEVEINGNHYGLSLQSKKCNDSFEINDGKIIYNADISIKYTLLDNESFYFSGNNISDIEDEVKKVIENRISNAFAYFKSKNVDIFHLADKCYAKAQNVWNECNDENYLDKISFNINANITILKN